tara:strand:- start:10 stop:570 length:561 start_codon:yes stop_codon:yes gene_type:complete
MVYRRILEWPNKNLKLKSKQSALDTDGSIYEDLLDTFKVSGGYGLSAPQIGFNVRVVVINRKLLEDREDLPDSLLMINPKVISREEETVFKEACFSLPGTQLEVSRSCKVSVEWSGLDGSLNEEIFEGYSAACIQHEIDHLDGILTIDRISQLRRSIFIKKHKKRKLLESRALKSSREKNKKRKKR